MARARSGGSPSAAWAVTLLGAGFFICGILAVLFFAQKGGLQEDLDSANGDLKDLVSTAEANSPAVQEAKANDQGMSAVGFLLARADTARNDLAQANQTVNDLQVEKADVDNKLKTAQELLNESQQNLAAATAGLAEARTTYQNQANALEARVGAAEETNLELQARLVAYENTIRNDNDAARRELQSMIDQGRLDNDELSRQLASAQEELINLRRDRATALAKIATPDADIVTVATNGTPVYLNIGANQKVTKGLTFSVYEEDDLVKLEGNIDLEPKAVIEVFEVLDNSATARVVQLQRGERVEVGDAAINVVFDPNLTSRFFAFGDFDLSNTGTTNPNDLDRVKSRIRQWDGLIADEISYNVDYLVLGTPPALPRELTGSERSDPIKIQQYNADLRKFNAYTELLAQADQYNIPVLSQNRFLGLIGYYER